MDGPITDRPLLIKQPLWRSERIFGDKLVITREASGYHQYRCAEPGAPPDQASMTHGTSAGLCGWRR